MNWREIPFIRLSIPLIIGIVMAPLLDYRLWLAPILLLNGSFFIALLVASGKRTAFSRRWLFGALLNGLLIVFGYSITALQADLNQKGHFRDHLEQQPVGALANVLDTAVTSSGNRLKLYLEVAAVYENKAPIPAAGRLLAYVELDGAARKLGRGDQIAIRAYIAPVPPPKNPKGFDYQQYLQNQGYYYQTFLKAEDWRLTGHAAGFHLLQWATRLRMYCLRVLRHHLPTDNERGLASALILGYKADISEEVRDAYAGTGAMHVLAVSGLHVGIVYLVFGFLLRWMDERGAYFKIIKTASLVLAVWGFAFVTGASPSVLRAATMFSLLIIGQHLNRHTNIYNTLAASAFVLLCIDPTLIRNIGFQLSYLAVAGIVFFQPRIYRRWYIKNRFGDYLWKLVCVSLAAQITTLPLSLYYFHQFPVYFWLSGLIVVPAAALLLGLGLLLFVVQAAPGIGLLTGKLLYGIAWVTNALVFLVKGLPAALVEGIWISATTVFLLYLAIGWVMQAISLRKLRPALFSLAALLPVALLFNHRQWTAHHQQNITVYYLDGESAIDLFDGKTAYCLSSLPEGDQHLQASAGNFRRYAGIRRLEHFLLADTTMRSTHWYYHHGILQFYNTRLAIVQHLPVAGPDPFPVDYLMLCNDADLNLRDLQKAFDFKMLIIDASNGYRIAENWEAECKDLRIPCHNIRQSGAIQIKPG